MYKYRKIQRQHPLLSMFEQHLERVHKESLLRQKQEKSGSYLATLGRALRCNVAGRGNDLHYNP